MRKLFSVMLTLIIAIVCDGQSRPAVTGNSLIGMIDSNTPKLIVKGSSGGVSNVYTNAIPSVYTDRGDKLTFYDRGKQPTEVLRLNSSGDTLELKSQAIKFIKIDGRVFEIKRSVELVEVKEPYSWFSGGWRSVVTPNFFVDTTLNKFQKNK